MTMRPGLSRARKAAGIIWRRLDRVVIWGIPDKVSALIPAKGLQ